MNQEKENCIFCKIVKGEINSDIVYSDDNFIGIKDVNPKVKGHMLLIPKKHFKTILDVPSSLGNEMLDAVKKVALKLIDDGKAEGFNILMNNFEVAGQVVPHAHIHILPRKKGDGLKGMYLEDAENKNK